MYMTKVISLLLVLQCCELCLTIKVPVVWDNGAESDVNENEGNRQQEVQDPAPPQNTQKQIPVEYFEYNAPKPQFAIDVAKFHGVPNPEEHYRSYPIKPYTNREQPQYGIHHMLDEDKKVFQPYQQYLNKNDGIRSHAKPASTEYEVFHPYKAEEPALQAIYKDPVLGKIRSDLENSKNRLQNYEKEAGKPHITKDEYLESPEETDRKLFPQNSVPAPYEIHRPERRPVYYQAPVRYNPRENVLNQKFRHPLNQNYVKIRPVHYNPLKKHLQQLRQHHAIKYDDERNEYPQVHPAEYNAEPEEGYDIYEKGREKYTQLRNNVDDSINKVVKENQPATYQKLELQNDETKNSDNNDDDEEFVPIKNYAQVRKTEVTKHLPREAAFDEAETLEEILNAPRLREAVKSKKAQTVYTEEGYEDAAYDHAGEQKHASEHEGHGGYLKENQLSGGLYKIPSVSSKYEDGRGSKYQDKTLHAEKWKHDNKDEEEEKQDEDYSEAENEQYVGAKSYQDENPNDTSYRNKREDNTETNNDLESQVETKAKSQHELGKREVNFKVPEINFTSTFLTEAEILKLAKQKLKPKKDSELKEKYPYYFKSLKGINKNSPLRYAENFKFIPKKSNGGTEFYDSRSKFECPEVEDVDPLPEKLKNGENPTEDETNPDQAGDKNSKDNNFDTIKHQPRLKGLGDKIDCFKAKYFGENPLDSPFFKEEIISNPEPITAPKLAAYTLETKKHSDDGPTIGKIFDEYEKYKDDKTYVFLLLDKFRSDQNKIHEPLIKKNEKLTKSLYSSPATSANNTQLSSVYNDVIENIKSNIQAAQKQTNAKVSETLLGSNKTAPNVTYNYYQNKDDVTKPPQKIRRKRATPFVYEPYKILRDGGQVQESKKTTTTANVSPLIKQLQSSRVVDRVNKSNQENEKQVKRNVNTRTYVDIGRKEREKLGNNSSEKTIVDVSLDPRRGEPRYEIRPANHKLEYTPVENKKSISVEDYKAKTTTEKTTEQSTTKKKNDTTTQKSTRTLQRTRIRRTTVRPVNDASQVISKATEIQNVAASNTVRKTVTTSAPETEAKQIRRPKKEPKIQVSSEEEYGEYEDEEVTTTTTQKPSFRRRIRTTSTTTEKPQEEEENEEVTEPELPKLRLITRFRNTPTEKAKIKIETTETPTVKKYNEEYDIAIPKYREKKKKTSTSTIVTDTKKYGDEEEDDDMRSKEVDALIGVTESLDDYIPLYEKEARQRRIQNQSSEDDDEDDDSDDDSDDDEDEEDDDEDEEGGDEESEEEAEPEVKATTPEPTKRTLVRTTDAPAPTTASRSEKLQNKPIVTKKKIEIHKETPVNKSSPHVSQFKQDIKEVEIIKEIPSVSKRKPQKNTEVLELYKDDNLAKDINKLGDVEIFNENIDLDKGPKHGGNYRVATKEDLKQLAELRKPKDAVASQSENTKHIELDEYAPKKMHGGNLKSISDIQRPRQRGRSSKLIELSDPPIRGMHGGNLRYGNKGRRGGRKSEKLIEIDDDKDDNNDDSSSSRESNFKSFNTRRDRMHGGNYRSAKLVQAPETAAEEGKKITRKDGRKNGAVLLNSFAQAVPILTTTPGYILDPSKRMYYYVDA